VKARTSALASLPAVAGFEIGEALPTTRMGEVFLGLGQPVLSGNATFGEGDTKGVVVQTSHARALPQREPALGIETAGQLDLHVAFPFAWPERHTRKRFFVNFERYAHAITLDYSHGSVKNGDRPNQSGGVVSGTPFRGAGRSPRQTGGRGCALTPGHHLSTLRVASPRLEVMRLPSAQSVFA